MNSQEHAYSLLQRFASKFGDYLLRVHHVRFPNHPDGAIRKPLILGFKTIIEDVFSAIARERSGVVAPEEVYLSELELFIRSSNPEEWRSTLSYRRLLKAAYGQYEGNFNDEFWAILETVVDCDYAIEILEGKRIKQKLAQAGSRGNHRIKELFRLIEVNNGKKAKIEAENAGYLKELERLVSG